jgi:hypothetical protein
LAICLSTNIAGLKPLRGAFCLVLSFMFCELCYDHSENVS